MTIENLTPAMERVLSMAEIEAGKDNSFVGSNHVAIAMILEGQNPMAIMLTNAGFTVEGLRNGKSPQSNS